MQSCSSGGEPKANCQQLKASLTTKNTSTYAGLGGEAGLNGEQRPE